MVTVSEYHLLDTASLRFAIYPGVPSGGGAGSSGACFLFGHGREMDRTKWMDDAVYVHL